VIVIDEIGREMEAAAARTIAERGVQLIGTAHGNTLENLMLNPTLADLVGGIESVTLSDDEARRRGTQKTVLERRSPPTFDVLIEIQTRDVLAVHRDVATAVDSLLRGFPSPPEMRTRKEDGSIDIKAASRPKSKSRRGSHGEQGPLRRRAEAEGKTQTPREELAERGYSPVRRDPIRIFPFGVARNRLENAAKRLAVPIIVEKDVGAAQVLVTLRTHYRKRQRIIADAERRGMPVYVLRANTVNQMERFLGGLFDLSVRDKPKADEDQVLRDTQRAIEAVLNGERWVELSPANSYVRRLQHELVKDSRLVSHSYGKDPNRRVRIFRE